MSLLEADSKFPIHTLRKHVCSITALEFVKVPIYSNKKTITLQNDSNSMVLKPFLLSSDESGKVILWDLTILRPIAEIQAHESQILTIRQLGIRDDIVDSDYFGLVLTHGRDHIIKIWRLFDDKGGVAFKKVYEIPVNALNFSNVDVYDGFLITPNTINSNTFDIYDINYISKENGDETRLKRLFESVDVFKKASMTNKFEEFNVKRDDEDDVNRMDKFGIIMKLLFINDNRVFIGYESGHVALIELDFTSQIFKIISISNHHFPNPVLSLTYDRGNSTVLSTSIDSNIISHNTTTGESTVFKLEKFGKISDIVSHEDKYVLSSWNGFIRFYEMNHDKKEFEYVSSFKKPKGLLIGDLNVIGNINEESGIEKNKIVKPNSLAINIQSEIDPQIKRLYGRRDVKSIETSYLAVGYDDGTITLYNDL